MDIIYILELFLGNPELLQAFSITVSVKDGYYHLVWLKGKSLQIRPVQVQPVYPQAVMPMIQEQFKITAALSDIHLTKMKYLLVQIAITSNLTRFL